MPTHDPDGFRKSSPMLPDPDPKPAKETDAEFGARLAAPFPKGLVKQRKGPGGKMLDYLTARVVMARLNEVAGPAGWETDLREISGGRGFICRLSVQFPSGWRHREDGSDESDIEPEKGGMSGALKRAAVQFGVGADLYKDTPPPKPVPKPKTDAEKTKVKGILSLIEKAESVDALRTIWTSNKDFITGLPDDEQKVIADLGNSRKADFETAVPE